MTELLRVDHLSVVFDRRRLGPLRAVHDVSLRLAAGRTLGLVGESGSGKTTVGRVVAGLQTPTSGRIELDGRELGTARSKVDRRRVQMVFQDPMASLDPRQRAIDAVGEPLRIQDGLSRGAARERALSLLAAVGLTSDLGQRYPHQMSGGQRQRVVIARAMALEPQVTICDEPVSALDVSVQAQVVNLLGDLQRDLGVSFLFIAHDLAVVRHIAHEVAVMHLGSIVEQGPVTEVYERPRHPYTVALLSAVLDTAEPDASSGRIVLRGEIPSPAAPPPGCTFHTRCFLYEALGRPARCREEEPTLVSVPGTGRQCSACHFHEEVPVAINRRQDADR